MSDKQRLVLSIIDFLNQSIQDGTVKQDDTESLEVASKLSLISCGLMGIYRMRRPSPMYW